MAAPMSCKPKNIDASAVRFNEVKQLDVGCKMVYLTHKGSKLFVQTPMMQLPYGVNDSTAMDAKAGRPADGPKRFDLSLSFRDIDRNPAVKTLHDRLVEIGEAAVDNGFKNRLAWFQKDYKMREFVDNMFTPLVKIATDKETGLPSSRYPPTLKVKLPYDASSDSFKFECVDANKNPVDFHSVKDKLTGASAQVLFQITGLWIIGSKFGFSTKAVKVKIEQAVKADVDFEEDSDDEKAAGGSEDEDIIEDALTAVSQPKKTTPTPVAKKPVVPTPVPVMLDDSDEEEAAAEEEEADADSEVGEEEEEEEEHEPTPPPPPPVKKPAVKKPVAKAAK